MRSVITLSGSEYIGMCQDPDPEDNLRVGYLDRLPSNGYFVPNNESPDYYPVLVVPVSSRHAVVIERNEKDTGDFWLYKANMNGGIYDPMVEECADVSDYEMFNVWEDDLYIRWRDKCVVNAISPYKNELIVVLRDRVVLTAEVTEAQHEANYPNSWYFPGWPYDTPVTKARKYTLNYIVMKFHASLKEELRLEWTSSYSDNILVPTQTRTGPSTASWTQSVPNDSYINDPSILPHYVNLFQVKGLNFMGATLYGWRQSYPGEDQPVGVDGYFDNIDWVRFAEVLISKARDAGIWWEDLLPIYGSISNIPWWAIFDADIYNYVDALEAFNGNYPTVWSFSEPSDGIVYKVTANVNWYQTDKADVEYVRIDGQEVCRLNQQHAVEYEPIELVVDEDVIT